MARALDVLLDQHVIVAERRGRLALAAGQRIDEVLAAFDLAHALATTTGAGLDQHRPGVSGTPALAISALAALLSPRARSALAGGPMKGPPAAAQASAKSAFSDRKP
ncbi:hypothetical protein G6F59_017792 [Rhizopus arrhizus]|nr:hypothetical protein G6F59_017792 [Rhizopus arrhizus]